MGIGVFGKIHPLRHNGLLALRQMAELFRKLGSQWKNGVSHPLIIGFGIGQAPPGQEFPVHVLPDVVGINEGTVHIK